MILGFKMELQSKNLLENFIGQDVLQPNGIRAVLFDLDGTLRYNRPSSEKVFLDFAVNAGVSDSPDFRLETYRWVHYYWAQSPELLEDLEQFKGREADFWMNYSRRKLMVFGCPADEAAEIAPQVSRYMESEHKPEDWVPPDVPATLEKLKQAGFRLGVLSNRTHPCNEYLESLGLIDYFDLALVAGEVACWKPEPEIFRHALERLALGAGQVVYVGDNYFADIVGARRAGLEPILIDPDGIFPDPGCTVIRTMGELAAVLAGHRQE